MSKKIISLWFKPETGSAEDDESTFDIAESALFYPLDHALHTGWLAHVAENGTVVYLNLRTCEAIHVLES